MTTAVEVVTALEALPFGSYATALDLHGSVQGISNALRHAEGHGWVSRYYPNAARGRAAVWSITESGRRMLSDRRSKISNGTFTSGTQAWRGP